MNNFYKRSIEELYQEFKSGPGGLSEHNALERLAEAGANILPHGERARLFQIVLHQFASPLIYVLIAAGSVSLLIREFEDAIFIFLIIIINAILGTYQEWKAESNAEALQTLVKTQAKVLRDDEPVMIDAEKLVPGDVVMMESGMRVAADIRLISCNNLRSEESVLTGESVAVEKKATIQEVSSDKELPLGDQRNMLFAGTTIMSGRGTGLVVATALRTEIGKIAQAVTETKHEKTPLVKRMERFARMVSIVVLVACLVIFVVGYIEGIPVVDIFFVAIAVAVSAIPEGLPIAMTVALSIGSSRMAGRNVIIRKLSAVEGLGSCNYIGTDKTGTLTVDQQTVKKIVLASGPTFEVTGAGYNGEGEITDQGGHASAGNGLMDHFIEAVTMCNEAELSLKKQEWKYQGDAIDVAFLALAYKHGKKPSEIRASMSLVKEIPFESERRYAAAVYRRADNKLVASAKGSTDTILDLCPDADREQVLNTESALALEGYRVLAVASGEVDDSLEIKGLTFLGFAALIDPLKPEARSAVEFCHEGGIRVAMITGDHPATALAIARDLGLAAEAHQVITGPELGMKAGEGDEEFAGKVLGKTVFARVSPIQKQQIVTEVRGHGNFVAVTGDGVNDAPALKSADIGVAMGYGSDVAKEAASIIVTDNNFASIAAGIEEGRYTYGNLRKIIYLLISTGAAEIMMVFMALLFTMPLPFLPVQLLWLNLVTNGAQDISLAFEKGEKYFLRQPPRSPKQGIFDRLMISQTLVAGALMTVLTFGLWYHLLRNLNYEEADARNIILLLMVLLQNFHVLNCRSERASIFSMKFFGNPVVLLAIVVAQGAHIASMHIPFMQNLLGIEPVKLSEWFLLLATASLILIVLEVFKWLYARRLPLNPGSLSLKPAKQMVQP